MSEKLTRREFLKAAGAGVGAMVMTAAGAKAAQATQAHPSEHAFKPQPNGVSILYDATRCIGCRACQTACREANHLPPEVDPSGRYDAPQDLSGSTWMLIQLYRDAENPERWSFIRRACMHCIEPACVAACPLGALYITPQGAVAYHPEVCFGCRYCMVSCPFGVPRYQWGSVTPFIQKCDLNTSNGRLAAGKLPACVEACPVEALTFGTREEMLEEAHRRIEEHPDRYVDHVYGEHEAGGTHVLYLSSIPFEEMGLPTPEPHPLPEKLKVPMDYAVPGIIVGMTTFTVAVYKITQEKAPETQGEKRS